MEKNKMKKKMRRILFDSWIAAGAKTWIYLTVVIAAGTLLSLTLFFSGGNTVENSLASSVDLSLSYTNSSYVSNHYDADMRQLKSYVLMHKPEANKEVYQMFLNNLDILAADPAVAYANYNIYYWFTTDQSDMVQIFGIDDMRFFEKENIRILEGTGEIKEGEAVVSDQQLYNTLQADGSIIQRKAVIGDTYTFINTYKNDQSKIFSLKVVGIYQSGSSKSEDDQDDFIGSSGMVTLNSTFRTLLEEHPEYYGGTVTRNVYEGISDQSGQQVVINSPIYYDGKGNFLMEKAAQDYQNISMHEETMSYNPFFINHIVLTADTFEHYASLKQKFDKFSLDMNRQAAKIFDQYLKGSSSSDIKFMLQTNENYFGSILDSIARIKKFYLFIFLSIYILLMISLYSFISYMQYGRSREIFIKYSLGSTRKKIAGYYMKYYALPGLMASIIACIPGYLLSWMLSSRTAAASAQRQNEFLQAEQSTQIVKYNGIALFDLSWQRMLLSFAAVVLIMELVIMICAWISTRKVLRGNLSNHARGGR
jgi:ABC-type antimicrobial peptide transport system permease subunit